MIAMKAKEGDKKLLTKWLKALRSGIYKRGEGILKKGTANRPQFCCLGVLCEVSKMGGWETTDGRSRYALPNGEKNYDYSPESVWKKIEPLVHTNQIVLAEMNDKGKSFKQIADFIEASIKE